MIARQPLPSHLLHKQDQTSILGPTYKTHVNSQFRNSSHRRWAAPPCFPQEGGVPRAVELLMETAREAKPTLLGNLHGETNVAKEAQEKAARAAHA